MRYFKLRNSADEELDITTTEILFHEISGLGFEEDNDFMRISNSWILNKSDYNQATISGSMLFNEGGLNKNLLSPYAKYRNFATFINKAPLTLVYYPFGETDKESDIYYRRVRVSKIEKSEINEYGVLDCGIDFITYTPWYQMQYSEMTHSEPPGTAHHWVWDTPIIFEPTSAQLSNDAIPAWFDWEPENDFVTRITGLQVNAPTKITIYGPCVNPYWTHGVKVGETVRQISTGGFSVPVDDPITLLTGDRLVISNLNGDYSITKLIASGGTQDLYSKRNFGSDCFVSFRNGDNVINVGSDLETPIPKVTVEVQKLYATI